MAQKNNRADHTNGVTTDPIAFEINVPQEKVDDILERVRAYHWDTMQMPAGSGWNYGAPLDFMKELADYWTAQYQWREHEQQMNRFRHFKAMVDDQELHFIHEQGSGTNRQPLLLLHGWPYSFYSLLNVIEPLTHPERSGGDVADAFDVIVPSLPGFGFSGKPDQPVGPQRIADLFNRLMTEVLGYEQYLVQGGDWGGYIASRLGFDHAEHLQGIHSNSFMVRHAGAPLGSGQTGPGPATEEEQTFVEQEAQVFMAEGGYSAIQGSRPLSLSYAMMDSPVGTAAWIVEKFHAWSDQTTRGFEEIFSKEQLLTEVMIYLVTNTFNTASWIYSAFLPEQSANLPPGQRVEVPTAFAAYPDPVFAAPPRSFMERSHNVVQWTEMPRGGHFPFLEEPTLFLEEIRKFAREVR